MSMFQNPAPPSSTGLEYQALKGSLLMIRVISQEAHVPTTFTLPGEQTPAIRADITVLDGPKQGQVYNDTLVFPKRLQMQLSRSIGATVLGRLDQGVAAKPGQSAPWILQTASPTDIANAEAFVAARGNGATSGGAGGNSGALPPF